MSWVLTIRAHVTTGLCHLLREMLKSATRTGGLSDFSGSFVVRLTRDVTGISLQEVPCLLFESSLVLNWLLSPCAVATATASPCQRLGRSLSGSCLYSVSLTVQESH